MLLKLALLALLSFSLGYLVSKFFEDLFKGVSEELKVAILCLFLAV